MNFVRPLTSVDPVHFRRVMGQFASGVTVVVAEHGGEVRGMTANAFMSGSLEPPLCIVSIAKRAHMHDHLIHAGRFTISILAAGQEPLATHFAGRPVAGLELAFTRISGAPALPGAAAAIAATLSAQHDCGDHTIFIGAIVAMESHNRPPLLYHASRFGALMPLHEKAPEMPEFW